MFHYAHPDEHEKETPLPEEFLSPHDLNLALDIWTAYQAGILPRAGGLLDQNPFELDMIHVLNGRHSHFLRMTPEDVEAERYKYADELNPGDLPSDMPPRSFGDFTRG